jgi:hypothetical protein
MSKMLLYNRMTLSALIKETACGFQRLCRFWNVPLSESLLNYLDSVADILQWAIQQTHTPASAGVTNFRATDRPELYRSRVV